MSHFDVVVYRVVQQKELLARRMLPLFVWKQLMQSPRKASYLRYIKNEDILQWKKDVIL